MYRKLAAPLEDGSLQSRYLKHISHSLVIATSLAAGACGSQSQKTATSRSSDSEAAGVAVLERTDAGLSIMTDNAVHLLFVCLDENAASCEEALGEFYPAERTDGEGMWVIEGDFTETKNVRAVSVDSDLNLLGVRDFNL